MSEQVQRQQRGRNPGDPSDADQARLQRVVQGGHDQGLDDLLDSIDAVLETNAEEYVRSFVQKGGQ